jgi:hypothetical protein
MTTKAVTIDFPEELVALLGPEENLPHAVLQTVVLDLLRHARITQGEAALLLGKTRYDILDLMSEHRIPMGPETAEEMREEIEAARRFMQVTHTGAGRQRQ